MPNKSAILTVAAAAWAFGLVVSGCNRDNRSATAMKNDRGPAARNQGSRPAEVLAASAYRPPARDTYEAPAMVAQAPTQPRYVQPRAQPQFTRIGPEYVQPQYAQVQYVQPQYVSAESYQDNPQLAYAHAVYSAPAPVPAASQYQARPVQPTPDLAMARAALPPPQPARPVVAVEPAAYQRAPIPELEPARFQRLPADRGVTRPAAEIMMSAGAGQPDRQEIQRALAPLADSGIQADPRQGWVASPATAMRGGW